MIRHHTRTHGDTKRIQTTGGSSNGGSKRNEETSGYIINEEGVDMGNGRQSDGDNQGRVPDFWEGGAKTKMDD